MTEAIVENRRSGPYGDAMSGMSLPNRIAELIDSERYLKDIEEYFSSRDLQTPQYIVRAYNSISFLRRRSVEKAMEEDDLEIAR